MPGLRRRLFALVTAIALVGSTGCNAWAVDQPAEELHHQRESFARDFAQTVITILHDHKKSYDDRKNILRRAFVDSVDIDWIAKFVLGHAWKGATDAQRERYMEVYRQFLTETYVANFAENPNKTIYSIKILGVNDGEKDGESGEFAVRTQMLLMNRENLKVDYRVHEMDGAYKVRDIIIENVSLITTHRAEFSELATAKGVDSLIKTLEERISRTREMAMLQQ